MLIEVTKAIPFDVGAERERINTVYKSKRDRAAMHAVVDAVEQWDLNRFLEQVERLDRTQMEYLCLPLVDLLTALTTRAEAVSRMEVALSQCEALPNSDRLIETAIALSAYPRFAMASEEDIASQVRAAPQSDQSPN
jgi:hypothetical protein